MHPTQSVVPLFGQRCQPYNPAVRPFTINTLSRVRRGGHNERSRVVSNAQERTTWMTYSGRSISSGICLDGSKFLPRSRLPLSP